MKLCSHLSLFSRFQKDWLGFKLVLGQEDDAMKNQRTTSSATTKSLATDGLTPTEA